jgi:hypothetical protein
VNNVTLEQARQIAAVEIERKKSVPRRAGYDFSPVELMADEPLA